MRLGSLAVFAAVACLLFGWAGSGLAATGDDVLLNEVLASHTGTDDTEYIELYGTPGYSLVGLSVIVVESDAFSPGTIDRRFDFLLCHSIGPNGFILIGNGDGLGPEYGVTPDVGISKNYLENSSLTIALVETSSLSGSSVTGSEVVLDAVALTDGDSGDTFFFGAPVIGPDGIYFPAGARRVIDGVDTDAVSDWVIGDFNLGSANTPTAGGPDTCPPLPLTIPEIQGDGQWSPHEGEKVVTTGIVTAITDNGRDMWIQDPDGDGNPLTSDGIFVDDRNYLPDPKPDVGDLVMVTAEVEEQQFYPSLPLTRLNNPDDYDFYILSSGNPLPAPVAVNNLPDVSVPDAIDFWEALEGMRVSVRNGFVVMATNRFGEFAMLAPADAKPNSGYFPQTKQILIRNLGGDEVDYNPERIMVDDSTIADPIEVMAGDRVRHLVGVLDYTFGMYKIQPTEFEVKNHDLPNLPASKRSGPKGDTAIVTFNLGRLVEPPEQSTEALELQLTKLALAIEVELGLPEIIVVQEVATEVLLQELGDRVNLATGTDYQASSLPTCDPYTQVGFLWDADRVSLVVPVWLMEGTDASPFFCPGPGDPFSRSRQPLIGVFDIEGHEVMIIGNHFKSKGGDDPLFGINQPADRITEVQRKAQAQVVRDYVNDLLDSDPDALVMVAGDLNDFEFGEPGEGPDHPIAILEGMGGEVPLYNLLLMEKRAERFTFVYEGNSEVLDHMLVSPALLARTVAADVLHFDTPFPASLDADETTPLQASDHDPLEGRFRFKKSKKK